MSVINAVRTAATADRVLRQLRNDRRSIALMLLVPSVLMGLLAWIVTEPDFNKYGPPLLGIFPFISMFLVTSVTTLRERTSGTLERLLSMPLGKTDFIFGYAMAFGVFAVAQSFLVTGLSVWVFDMSVASSAWLLLLVAVADALLGTALGLFVSAFANSEFQAVQFMPAVVLPQLLLCGLIVPRDELPTALRLLSDIMPLSYAVDATQQIMMNPQATSDYWINLAIVVGFVVVALALGAATLRRRTP